jgi:hypothetical protein
VVAVARSLSIAVAVAAIVITAGACSSGAPTPTPAHAAPAHAPAHAAAAHPAPGWPIARAEYLGRYRMTRSDDPSFARSGLLTLFMRQVTKPKAMVVPSGIISAYGANGTTLLYLTKFGHLGTEPVADVNVGVYTSPPVGAVRLVRFTADQHELTLLFSAQGSSHPVEMSFVRYSADPHP